MGLFFRPRRPIARLAAEAPADRRRIPRRHDAPPPTNLRCDGGRAPGDATFTGAFLLDDDILVEPNGHQVVLGGITVAEFSDGKIQTFRAYFDEAALLEQMMETA